MSGRARRAAIEPARSSLARAAAVPSGEARVTAAAGGGCSRRALLARLVAIAGSALVAPSIARADEGMALGIQLYTVRTLARRDLDATLGALSSIGYRTVELAGWYDRPIGEWRELLDKHRLTAPSAHVPFPEDDAAWDATLARVRETGCRWAVIPWVDTRWRGAADDWMRLAQRLSVLGARAAEQGVRLAYHNHDFEFAAVGDESGFEILRREVDRETVAFELDLYWLVKAGEEPEAVLRALEFVPLLHCKDIGPAPTLAMRDVGAGTLDWRALVARARAARAEACFVEHDEPEDPLASARRSHATLAPLVH